MVKAWWDVGGAFPPSFHHQNRVLDTKKGQDSRDVKSLVPNMKEADLPQLLKSTFSFMVSAACSFFSSTTFA